ncbi:MAG: hypothetical protein WCE52_18025 [Candidatus Acidiferrum sp.]
MALPEQIAVRYMDEDAGYVSVRPVVKQTFRLNELVDMVVSVAGKDVARVQQIFKSGTVVYNGYRYSWDGIAAELAELEALLIPFPDDEPGRLFVSENATSVILEIGGGTQHHVVVIERRNAADKKVFAKQSPWDVLVQAAKQCSARYEKYSHARKADLFRISLPYDKSQELLSSMLGAAPRQLRYRWSTLRPPSVITFVCPRK